MSPWKCSACLFALGVGLTVAPAEGRPYRPFLFGAAWDVNAPAGAKALFYEAGCNFVRLSGGGYNWSLEQHRQALAELKGHGIRTLLQLGSHWPDGAYIQRTGDMFVDDEGKTGVVNQQTYSVDYSGQPWPQYSYASLGFRAALEKDFTNYLDALKADTSVEALLLHNEPGYFWTEGRIFDYNPQAIARFREWLPSQHRDIAELNARWGTSFASFAEVDPPRQRNPVTNIAAWMDWRRFHIWLIEDFLTWEQAFARRMRPDLPSTTNLSGPIDNWFPMRLGDPYRFTEPFGIAGIDIYAGEWTNRYFFGYAMDMTRGAAQGRPIYVAECETYDPSHYPKLTEAQRADRLRSDLWTYIGHGANAILMWTLCGQEGFRLTEGQYNDRMKAVREVAHLSQMLRLGDFKTDPQKVALCVDQDASLYYGGLGKQLEGGQRVQKSLQGLYAALVEAGYGVDIVSADQVREGKASPYKALILSTPALADETLAQRLEAYVTQGGLLVAEAPFGQFDRWGKEAGPSPAFGLDRLFGVKASAPYDDGDLQNVASLGFGGKGRTKIELSGATATAAFGDGLPAVTQRTVGKGTAVFIATDAGVANQDGGQAGLGKFLGRLIAAKAALSPEIVARADGFLGASAMTDDRENRLLVITSSADQLLAVPERKNVKVRLQSAALPAGSRLFAFEPSRVVNGRTFAGARRLAMPALSGGALDLSLPSVTSATALLVAGNHDPLLAIEAPEAAKPGDTVQIAVTCYNPSSQAVDAKLALNVPSDWRAAHPVQSAAIPARSEKRFVFSVVAGPKPSRSVVKAILSATGKEAVPSVPVDVYVR